MGWRRWLARKLERPNKAVLPVCPACGVTRVCAVDVDLGLWYCFACHTTGKLL